MEGRRGRCCRVTGGGTTERGQEGEGQMDIQYIKCKGRDKLDTTVGYVTEYRGFYG